MKSREPQRLATWVLSRCTPDYRRESLIGDLMEQYQQRGGWWYWRQALGAARAHSVRLLLTATETQVPAAEYIGDLVMWIALGMCAVIQLAIYSILVISLTPLIASEVSVVVVGALLAASLFGAVTTAHEIRIRTAARGLS
jgi:hypothetical protein